MINLQKLRYLSSICAYCNKVIPMEERTNDHIIPRCLHGETEIQNIVICCQDCNGHKGSTEINKFLEEHPDKAECFSNYLRMIDYQSGNEEYSNAVMNNLSLSLQKSIIRQKKKKAAKRKRQKERKQKAAGVKEISPQQIQNIEYKLKSSEKSFYLNELQSKILDYYLTHPNFSCYKELAKQLEIGNERLIREIVCINNLTGIFKLKKISENGVILNDLFNDNLSSLIKKNIYNDFLKK